MDALAVPERLYPLRYHHEQQRLFHSKVRFPVVPAGRRSGKTELAKRKLIQSAIGAARLDARFFAGAPTRDQAKRIFWPDLKAMVSPALLARTPSESELCIKFIHGPEIWVVGLDKPERIEGSPWDGGVVDEIANTKPSAWPQNIRPALSDRRGWCWLIGVPEGRNHYYDLAQRARSHADPEWDYFSWPSADILPPEEVESARRDLDPLVFQQEYEASFISFEGRCYYAFLQETHCAPLEYNPRNELILSFDFNVDPGVAVVCQEQTLPNQFEDGKPVVGTGVIGEVYIPRNSNTEAVCRRLLTDWGTHQGRISVYGDATGGARKSSALTGSDWDIVRRELSAFPQGAEFYIPNGNPAERARINAVNSRFRSGAGTIRMMIDPVKAPHTVRDFEGVSLLKGGSGEIDKKANIDLSHLSDAVGYMCAVEYPVSGDLIHQYDSYTGEIER